MTDADDRDPMELQPMALADVGGNPLTPSTLGQAMQLSNMLAKSSLVPEAMQGKPVNVLMALMKGAEVGMTPVQTLSSVFVVDGKTEFYGKGMLAIVMQHPAYYDRKEWFSDSEGNVVEHQAHCAHCVMYRTRRDGSLTQFSGVFSLEEAHQGELQGKKNWRKSPDRMLMWRARSIAADAAFPDALRGLAPRPNQSAADFAAIELRPAISEAFESHGIKPPQADEPLTITCNCIDGAGFPRHDCPVCEGSGEYIDPRTDRRSQVYGNCAKCDPNACTCGPEPEDDEPPIELPDDPDICDNCDEPFKADAENVTTCAKCNAELTAAEDATWRKCGECDREFQITHEDKLETRCVVCKMWPKAKAAPEPELDSEADPAAPRAYECPVCEGPTTRSSEGKPMTCDDCNTRAAKGA